MYEKTHAFRRIPLASNAVSICIESMSAHLSHAETHMHTNTYTHTDICTHRDRETDMHITNPQHNLCSKTHSSSLINTLTMTMSDFT